MYGLKINHIVVTRDKIVISSMYSSVHHNVIWDVVLAEKKSGKWFWSHEEIEAERTYWVFPDPLDEKHVQHKKIFAFCLNDMKPEDLIKKLGEYPVMSPPTIRESFLGALANLDIIQSSDWQCIVPARSSCFDTGNTTQFLSALAVSGKEAWTRATSKGQTVDFIHLQPDLARLIEDVSYGFRSFVLVPPAPKGRAGAKLSVSFALKIGKQRKHKNFIVFGVYRNKFWKRYLTKEQLTKILLSVESARQPILIIPPDDQGTTL